MPLFLQKHLPGGGEVGLWRIGEPESWFRERLELSSAEALQLEKIKGRRRVEWLAARHLVHQMSGRDRRCVFLKDEFGKPHLEHSDFQISISHSHEMAAAIAAPVSVGVDIQYLVGKIGRLAHKYMRLEEMESLQTATRLEQLHVYWGAKEALYKAYGRRELEFCNHILVEPFKFNALGGHLQGKISKNGFLADYELWYEIVGAYVLVYGREVNRGAGG